MKYQFIQAHQRQHRIGRLCQALNVSSSGYYAWRPSGESAHQASARLVARMTQLHRQMKGRYGAIKLWRTLVADCVPCGHHRLTRFRRQHGLVAQRVRRFRVVLENHQFAPPATNQLQQIFIAPAPNRIWAAI